MHMAAEQQNAARHDKEPSHPDRVLTLWPPGAAYNLFLTLRPTAQASHLLQLLELEPIANR